LTSFSPNELSKPWLEVAVLVLIFADKFNLCAFPEDLCPSNKLEGPGAL
jgi:hypothetical protein